ncbi:DUF305 domain-containing protein [Microvirga lotononidis]|uniref:DUF305 domain-containing protein n=1 Tax=Microvirga lotononidis TaxID=864069 RepID=I4YTX9_9HYPH|nr:DUF305 domain-containing protein [Microvirga lotononidis]EIM27421.1 hypothetical protein MicloDRAFT_00039860 [Microvirga lotononidis]WQO28418.1 DUF305 domain-containing protein [Microvirga lotononidis]
MAGFLKSQTGLNWRAAALLGLISSTFSTLVSQFLAARIGRDAVVDWMVVATIPLRDGMLQSEPSWSSIAAGILFHQWADFSWALVFFGLFGRWTADLKPQTLLLIALPWALFTSALEWFSLVPLIPFWQPIFTLNQPYWIGFLVHALSAMMYPLFPWLRDWLRGRLPSRHGRFTAVWSGLSAVTLLALGFVALLGWQNRELPWMGENPAFDQSYMRRMAAHHAQGVELARLAVEKAQDPYLKNLAHLMAADQKGEIAIFQQWWRSWFAGGLPPASPEEHASMPGMLSPAQMDSLRGANGNAFDPLFISLMTTHHQGAILMADRALRGASDLRLRLMAHATRHAQRGEIELMHGSQGFAAVKSATLSLLLPAGEARADQRGAAPSMHAH